MKRRVMTIEDKLEEMLVEHGMWPEQAEAVMEIMKVDDIHESMIHRWGDDVEDYPQGLLLILWGSAKVKALEYIDANCPEAWFRPMFIEPTADGAG